MKCKVKPKMIKLTIYWMGEVEILLHILNNDAIGIVHSRKRRQIIRELLKRKSEKLQISNTVIIILTKNLRTEFK